MVKEPKITNKEEEQGKTLFEHIGLTGGGKNSETMEKYKKLLISCCVFMVIGYIMGIMLDIMLNVNYYGLILALAMLLIWILRVFGKYLKVK